MSAIVIHQPEYLPWINLFFKMVLSDIFVFLDNVQYSHGSFQNRNKIKTKQGAKWLTVPLKHEYTLRDKIIMKMKIDNSQDWRKQHLSLIKDSYKSTPYFKEILPVLEPVYEHEWHNLSDLNCNLTMKISEKLGINTKFIKSSELSTEGKRSELVLNICLKLKATKYISGIGAKVYLDEKRFKQNDIDIIYIPPVKIEYRQAYGGIEFIPGLSIIDYLFNNGVENFVTVARENMTGYVSQDKGIKVNV